MLTTPMMSVYDVEKIENLAEKDGVAAILGGIYVHDLNLDDLLIIFWLMSILAHHFQLLKMMLLIKTSFIIGGYVWRRHSYCYQDVTLATTRPRPKACTLVRVMCIIFMLHHYQVYVWVDRLTDYL